MFNFNIFFWHWWLLATILMTVEVLFPGMFFLWASISAFLIGGVCFLFPWLDLTYQIFLFTIAAITSAWVGKTYLKYYAKVSDQPHLNRRAEQYIGRLLILDQPILNGYGKIKVDDSLWKITGKDCPIGTQVKVKGVVSGNILEVEVLNLK